VSITKYLSRYAEAECTTYPVQNATQHETYNHVLVVPLFDEWHDPASTCVDQILQHVSQRVLTVAVVNTPEGCAADAYARTQSLLRQLHQRCDTLVIDRASHNQQLALNKGVGLARKIGSDVALKLIEQGHVRQPWIYQTDADAVLPANYFSQTMPEQGTMVFAHHHISEDTIVQQAADLYDLHMRYYVAGLAHAGSAYAHPSLGSTIAIHAQTYADVRGYPSRNAGEDFYLLNKACKIAPVYQNRQVDIQLAARLSRRVPFGTGPALIKITHLLATQPDGASYLSYHPHSFDLLQQALAYLQQAAITPQRSLTNELTKAPNKKQDKELNDQHRRATDILLQLGYARIARTLYQQYPDPKQRSRILTQWFDGFRQLRFIHQARVHFPDQPLLHSVTHAPFTVP